MTFRQGEKIRVKTTIFGRHALEGQNGVFVRDDPVNRHRIHVKIGSKIVIITRRQIKQSPRDARAERAPGKPQ